ncbi:YlbF family regulator, partial [Streptococcus pyogenes]
VDTGLPLAPKQPKYPSGPYQNIKEKGLSCFKNKNV